MSTTYYAHAFLDRDRLAPRDNVPCLGLLVDPADPGLIVGQAFAVGHIGGAERAEDPYGQDYPPPELVFRLRVDREHDGGMTRKLAEPYTVEGRFALRRGVFVELAEDAL